MSRLMDADAIGLNDFEILLCDGSYKEALKMLLNKIETAPTVEIIHCLDCKHWDELLNLCKRTKHMALGVNGFCSKAERRGEADG